MVYRSIAVVCHKLALLMPPAVMIGLTMVGTVALALAAFKVLEEPCTRLGKKLTSSKQSTPKETLPGTTAI